MIDSRNPLLCDDPEDTLHQAHCLLLLLKKMHACNDYHAFEDNAINTGIYGLLQCANHAIAYEINQMHKKKEAQSKGSPHN